MTVAYALGVIAPALGLLLLIALVATIAPDPSRAVSFERPPEPRRARRRSRRRSRSD